MNNIKAGYIAQLGTTTAWPFVTDRKPTERKNVVTLDSSVSALDSTGKNTSNYTQIRKLAKELGLLRSRDRAFYIEAFASISCLAASVALTLMLPDFTWLLSLALIVLLGTSSGIWSTRDALHVHDIVHKQAPKKKVLGRSLRKPLSLFMGNVLIGMSYTWWREKHNEHHDNPNDPEKDPDIKSNYITYTRSQLADKNALQRFMARFQLVVFCTLIPLQAISFRLASISFLARKLKTEAKTNTVIELAGIGLHFAGYALFLYILSLSTGSWWYVIAFVISHQGVFGVYNSIIFAPNHKGMPTELTPEQKNDPLILQIVTARNVKGGWFFEWLSGGLASQIEHHVYREMPRYTLPEFRPHLKKFCRDNGIPYAEEGVFKSYKMSLGSLRLKDTPNPYG